MELPEIVCLVSKFSSAGDKLTMKLVSKFWYKYVSKEGIKPLELCNLRLNTKFNFKLIHKFEVMKVLNFVKGYSLKPFGVYVLDGIFYLSKYPGQSILYLVTTDTKIYAIKVDSKVHYVLHNNNACTLIEKLGIDFGLTNHTHAKKVVMNTLKLISEADVN